jgi:hypothetical protein
MFIRIINFSGAQVPRKPKFTRAWVREADRASRDIVSVLKTLQRRTRQPSCSQWGSPSGALWAAFCGIVSSTQTDCESRSWQQLRETRALALLPHLLSPLCLFVCTLRHYRVHCAPRDHSVAQDARGRVASYGRIRNRKRASAETNPRRTSFPSPLSLLPLLPFLLLSSRQIIFPFRPLTSSLSLQPASSATNRISVDILHSPHLESPLRSVLMVVSHVLLFIQCRVREFLAGSIAGLWNTRQKSHENHFNSRRVSTYPAGDKARERIIADECFREW